MFELYGTAKILCPAALYSVWFTLARVHQPGDLAPSAKRSISCREPGTCNGLIATQLAFALLSAIQIELFSGRA
jgi:hypothetical protein